ncbi:MAG TPA: GGDEF domain-containing protein, partial [Pseudomonas sp.]|nr:GGDEF domain-containing protein [Pseudomonas sp.]
KLSTSPDVHTFLYASVVFIVLGNLGVRYSFRGILACSLIISAIILGNVALIHQGELKPVLVFTLVYLPVLAFSLFISWTNISGVRKAFLADLEGRSQRAELATLNARLHELASTDALTGIGNRRAFDRSLLEHWQQMTRNGRPFALLLTDIDYFKSYNDQYGHQTGDRCLHAVAGCMETALRSGQGSVFRYGGEEFAILLQVREQTELSHIAERLRQQVAAVNVIDGQHPTAAPTITISLGGILSSEPGLLDANSMLADCDARLYRAKQAGRDQSCFSSDHLS